jgi:aryl-alcohol dehydrogenase-like predicted oxidoreductase
VPEVIPGARTAAQARANAAAAGLPALPDPTLAAIADLYGRRVRDKVHHRW